MFFHSYYTLSADIDVLYLCYFYWVEIGLLLLPLILLLLLLLLLLIIIIIMIIKNNNNHNHNGRRGSLVINGARNGEESSPSYHYFEVHGRQSVGGGDRMTRPRKQFKGGAHNRAFVAPPQIFGSLIFVEWARLCKTVPQMLGKSIKSWASIHWGTGDTSSQILNGGEHNPSPPPQFLEALYFISLVGDNL